eukprot:TRINITY_DN63201_c0_g1_i1.p1 TRINITY_DN63201_c0_g1~~TRINITY_DN63201_c0_g1_i1.p1  ORF type:complete len:134 (+),score=8.71 TRINITY_DN63201_c0_g1_i1:254-655(+)
MALTPRTKDCELLNDYYMGCCAECGKKCVVDEGEIEIVGPMRQVSSGSGWVQDWITNVGSTFCTPRVPYVDPNSTGTNSVGGFNGSMSGFSAAVGAACSLTGPRPTPRSTVQTTPSRSAPASRPVSRARTPRP